MTHAHASMHRSFFVVNYYLMSFKFHKDPSFCWGHIALFVTLYNLEVKILGLFSFWIIAKSKISFLPLRNGQVLETFYVINKKNADTQKDYFCPGTGIWIWECTDNSFGQICKIKCYKSKYYGVSDKNVVKLSFIWTCISQNQNTISSLLL